MNVSLCSLNEMITYLGHYKKRFEIEADVNFILANSPLSLGGHIASGDQKSFVLPR